MHSGVRTAIQLRVALAALAIALLLTSIAGAASLAEDDPSDPAYAAGWLDASNGGTGFGPWSLTPSTGPGFTIESCPTYGDDPVFVESSTEDTPQARNAERALEGALEVGQSLTIDALVTGNGESSAWIEFLTGDGTTALSYGGPWLDYTYHVADASGSREVQPIHDRATHTLHMTTPSSYAFTVDDGTPYSYTIRGELIAAPIRSFRIGTSRGGDTFFARACFGQLTVPEASETPLAALGTLAALTRRAARRRAPRAIRAA